MGPIKGDRARAGIAVGIARLDDWWDALLLRLDNTHDTLEVSMNITLQGFKVVLQFSKLISGSVVE